MPRRTFVALPFLSLAAIALLGAHCSSSDQATSQEAASGAAAASGSSAPGAALPSNGLTESETTRLLPGIKTSELTPKQRQDLVELTSDTFCPCSSTTVAGCLRAETVCRPAVRLTELAAELLLAGQSQTQTLLRIEAYYNSFPENRRIKFDEDGPVKGKADAKITIVEFSDFECPSCRAVHPVLESLVNKYPNDVRLVFLNFPLTQHPHAKEAAIAGAWAAEQGRFWPFANLVFQNQSRLDEIGVEALATQAGLDAKAMTAALESDPKYAAKVEKDKAQGEAARITGTPSLFINGRQLVLPPSMEYLSWTIEDELEWIANGKTWAAQ